MKLFWSNKKKLLKKSVKCKIKREYYKVMKLLKNKYMK